MQLVDLGGRKLHVLLLLIRAHGEHDAFILDGRLDQEGGARPVYVRFDIHVMPRAVQAVLGRFHVHRAAVLEHGAAVGIGVIVTGDHCLGIVGHAVQLRAEVRVAHAPHFHAARRAFRLAPENELIIRGRAPAADGSVAGPVRNGQRLRFPVVAKAHVARAHHGKLVKQPVILIEVRHRVAEIVHIGAAIDFGKALHGHHAGMPHLAGVLGGKGAGRRPVARHVRVHGHRPQPRRHFSQQAHGFLSGIGDARVFADLGPAFLRQRRVLVVAQKQALVLIPDFPAGGGRSLRAGSGSRRAGRRLLRPDPGVCDVLLPFRFRAREAVLFRHGVGAHRAQIHLFHGVFSMIFNCHMRITLLLSAQAAPVFCGCNTCTDSRPCRYRNAAARPE